MKYERYVSLTLIAFLIGCLFYFTQCNKKTAPTTKTTVATKCDTIKERVLDTIYRQAELPAPKRSTAKLYVPAPDTIVETDTLIKFFYDTIHKITYVEKEVPVLVYDSVYRYPDYSLFWKITNFTDGRLKSFEHFINFKYTTNQTNNFSTVEIPRKFYVQYLVGMNLNRSNTIHGIGGGYEWRRFSAGMICLHEFKVKETSILLTGKIKF